MVTYFFKLIDYIKNYGIVIVFPLFRRLLAKTEAEKIRAGNDWKRLEKDLKETQGDTLVVDTKEKGERG